MNHSFFLGAFYERLESLLRRPAVQIRQQALHGRFGAMKFSAE
jgi:hypothetical protein